METPGDTSLTGRLVVAAPSLRDPNFAHAVVLLLEHGREGALGVVLNRPSEIRVEQVLPRWAARAVTPEVVFVGGPVQTDALIGLRRSGAGEPGSGQILPGVGALDLSSGPGEQPGEATAVRLYAGYAGWDAGQLESEIADGGWFMLDGDEHDAFTSEPEDLWRSVIVRQGGIFRTVPSDPSTN